MTMHKIYNCNICEEEINNPYDTLFGICFKNNTDFTLGGYGSTDGQHLCYRCAKQLKEHLNSEQISKELQRKKKEIRNEYND